MQATITAIYENGVLRPLKPLALQEHQTVELQILSPEDNTEAAIQALLKVGLLTPPSHQLAIQPISDAERKRIADLIGASISQSISQMIIEERTER